MCFQIDDSINLVRPKEIEVFRDSRQNVGIRRKSDGSVVTGLKVSLMFPLTDRDSFIQLLDAEGREVGILRSTHGLDEESRQVIQSEIAKYYFVPTILSIESIEEQFSSDLWRVITERGPRSFEVVGKKRSIQYISPDRLIIKDIDGNRYEIKSVKNLDKSSRRLLDREV